MTVGSATEEASIGTEPRPACLLCGEQGRALYRDLKDRLFGAAGTWTLKECPKRECGLVWLDPAPRKEEVWKAYRRYYTHQDECLTACGPIKRTYRFFRDCYLSWQYGYGQGQVYDRLKWLGLALYLFPGKRADVDFSVMYLPNRPAGRLLDIGCGSGAMLMNLRSAGWQVEGIEVDAPAVENARQKGLHVRRGDVWEQQYSDNTFDAVVLSHVIEHVSDPIQLMAECRRILKPGGVMSVVTPNMGSLGRRIWGDSWFHLDPPRHLVLHNTRTIRTVAQRAGFVRTRVRTTVRDAHTCFRASTSMQRHGGFTTGTRPGAAAHVSFVALRWLEWVLTRALRSSGEEISLLGWKEGLVL